MIGKVLVALRDHLNDRLKVLSRVDSDTALVDPVVFVEGHKMEPITFEVGSVSMLLINLEEERDLRPPNRYAQVGPTGNVQRVQPDIRLSLHVLFVARFKQYEQAWEALSQIIQHFQAQPVITRRTVPDLAPEHDQLTFELMTLKFAEQNEVWNALRTTYHPSILYKVKMVVFRDPGAVDVPTIQEEIVEGTTP